MRYDIVIHNGKIITINTTFDIIANGIVCIKGGKLQRIGTADSHSPLPPAEDTIDAEGGIIMPGLVNAHTHLPMTLFRGLADDLPLLEWLNTYIFPAESKHINLESTRLGSLLGCAEVILSGTTTCCDGYFYEDGVASAVYESGLRAILGQGIIDFPAPGVPDPSGNIQNAVAFVEKWQHVSGLISPSIFCHSPYTCSAATLKKAKSAAISQGLLFQIHVAETKAEWDQIRSEHRTSPIQYLDRIGILDENTLLVHAIWVDPTDIGIIAKRNAKVVHNPESNMKLGSGIAPIPEFLAAGIAVGLGTDGCASNNNLDLFQEMDFAAKLHKVNTLDPTVMDARTILKMATIDGAKAIGLDKDTGSLEIGKQADVIIIDTCKAHLVPMYNPISHIVYSACGSDVRDVVVAGKSILRNRKLLTIDIKEIIEKVTRLGASVYYSPSNSVNENTL
jgi:5-methylthioadenosine/S-adenosylhomocysteine deaminase